MFMFAHIMLFSTTEATWWTKIPPPVHQQVAFLVEKNKCATDAGEIYLPVEIHAGLVHVHKEEEPAGK
jgi:hypothetical protein